MAGKTRLVMELLSKPECFNPPPKYVYYYYGEYQDCYRQLQRKLKKKGVEMHLRQGSNLKLEDIEKKNGQSIYVIDDATGATASSDELGDAVTKMRHRNASLWLIWHELYSKHPASRSIKNQTFYFFFLPGPLLASQLKTLDDKLKYGGALVDAYQQATSDMREEHRYLLLNLHPYCEPKLKLRSQIHKDHQYAYLT